MSEEVASTTEKPNKGKNKKIVIAVVAVVILAAIAACAYWVVEVKIPHDNAVASFESAVASLDQKNGELDAATEELRSLAQSEDKPLAEDMPNVVSSVIGEAQAAKESAPEMPEGTDDINAAAAQIENMGDYSATLAKLSETKTAYENSVKQMKQVTNPTEAFVIQRINGVASVTGVEAVSEGNDPNGKLNKSGGYTATVYFTSDLVDESKLTSTGDRGYTHIVALATDGGGAVEVYGNAEDAQKRVTYLSAFDGSIFSNGSHEVVGTCVVRTSDHLTASQQNELSANVIAALTRLE